MKRFVVILLGCVFSGAVVYAIYRNQNSYSVGKVEYCSTYENEVKKALTSFKVNASFCHFNSDKMVEAVQKGKAQLAYGEIFADGDYKDVIKSNPYGSTSFGVYQSSKVTEVKKVGYSFDFVLPSLKTQFKGVEFVKFDSTETALKAVRDGKIDAVCISDLITGHMDKDFTFKTIGLTKQLVFISNKTSKIDINVFVDHFKNALAESRVVHSSKSEEKKTTKVTKKN
jgi:ABC-type amino acid transport substrate-binding protein